MAVSRIGILTGGGDCPGLNAVIRAVVKRAKVELGWEVIGIPDGFAGLMEDRPLLPLGLDEVSGILPKGGTILGTSNRADPYRDAEGRDRSAEVAEKIRALGLDALITVGGDGTQTISQRLFAEQGVATYGVPKTIDNDVAATDYTFGFDSARVVATDAVDRLHSTAESHDRVMVLEVMGRDAGFIAAHSGLAGGADAILIPEIPFDLERVAAKLAARRERGRRFSVVVVAEGARPRDGSQSFLEGAEARPGRNVGRLGGVGASVAHELEALTGMEARVTVLGHLQRGGSPTPFDRVLGSAFGCQVLSEVAAERPGRMVALRGNDVVSVPLTEAIGRPRRVAPDGQLVRCAQGLGIVFG